MNYKKKRYLEISRKKIKNSIYFLNQDLNLLKNKITREYKAKLFTYELALSIAQSIDLKDDILIKRNTSLSGEITPYQPEALDLFYKGEKVISSEIKNLKKQMDNIEMNDKYNSIVSKIKTEEINLNSIERNDEYIDLLEIEKELKDNLNLLNKEIFSLYPVIIKSIKPYKAISPRKLNYLLSGIFFGIVISLVIIFLKTYKNNRVS